MPDLSVIILAAGLGSRLGSSKPKCLSVLDDGTSILQRQLDALDPVFGPDAVHIVVGYKRSDIMRAHPGRSFIHNKDFATSNTAWSLRTALAAVPPGPVLWLNGDVVFDPRLVEALVPAVQQGVSFVCVNTAQVGEEEIKYTVDERGCINSLSKTVVGGLGEAVGVNFVAEDDRPAFERRLAECAPQDYFERGLELAIERDDLALLPLDIGSLDCIEVDFVEDLVRARTMFGCERLVIDDAGR